MLLLLLTGLSLLKIVLAADYRIVTSPYYYTRSFYPNNWDWEYDIRVNNGSGVKLQWETFDIKGTMPNCSEDYVEIYIGCGRHSIGRYCSNNIGGNVPFDVYSPDNCLRIKLHSDDYDAGLGFRARYSSFPLSEDEADTTTATPVVIHIDPDLLAKVKSKVRQVICHATKSVSCSTGVIKSPNWPDPYPHSYKDCYWKIEVGSRKNVKIAFMDFGCNDGRVEIKEGDDDDSYDQSSTIRDSNCDDKNPFYFTSTKRRIWIRLQTGEYGTRRQGFVAGYAMYDSIATSSKSGSETSGGITGGSIAAIVLGVTIMFAAAFYYQFVYRMRQIRRVQEQQTVNEPPQELTAHLPSCPPQPDDAPTSQPGYAPQIGFEFPLQPEHKPLPRQGNAPSPHTEYAFPPQLDYVPTHQPECAPPSYSQVAGAPFPHQGSGGGITPYPPEIVPPYLPVQPPGGTRYGHLAPTVSNDPPYSLESHGGTALYTPGKPRRVLPYPAAPLPDGATADYSVPLFSSHPPYSLESCGGRALDAPRQPERVSPYLCEQLPSGATPDHSVKPVSSNPLHHPKSDEETALNAHAQPGEMSPHLCEQPSNDTTPVPSDPPWPPESGRGTVLDYPTPTGGAFTYTTEQPPAEPAPYHSVSQVSSDTPYPQESGGGTALDSLTQAREVPSYPNEQPSDDATADHLVPLVLSDASYLSESGGGAAPDAPSFLAEQPSEGAATFNLAQPVSSDPTYTPEIGGAAVNSY